METPALELPLIGGGGDQKGICIVSFYIPFGLSWQGAGFLQAHKYLPSMAQHLHQPKAINDPGLLSLNNCLNCCSLYPCSPVLVFTSQKLFTPWAKSLRPFTLFLPFLWALGEKVLWRQLPFIFASFLSPLQIPKTSLSHINSSLLSPSPKRHTSCNPEQ